MRKSKQFISMPVISLEEGKQIGVIKGLVVNPELKKVVALIVEQKSWFHDQKFTPYSNVHSVGDDAITVKHGTIMQKGINLPEIISLTKNKTKICGARMVTESGAFLGESDDYCVNSATGEIIGLEFSSSFINGLFNGKAFLAISYIVTIGAGMIICSDQALSEVVKIDGGLQAKLKTVKDSTNALWESTVQKTKGIGANVNIPLARIKHTKQGAEPEEPEKPDENLSNRI